MDKNKNSKAKTNKSKSSSSPRNRDLSALTEDERLELRMKQKRMPLWKKLAVSVTVFLCVFLLLVLSAVGYFFDWVDGKLSLMNQYSGADAESENLDNVKDYLGNGDKTDTSFSDEFKDEMGNFDDLPQTPAPHPDEDDDDFKYEVIEGKFDGEFVSKEYEDEVLNILLIGADTLDGKHARSDTMMLMSVNTLKKRIVFTSFMRDSYVELPELGYNRLNAAHSIVGTNYLIQTIEHNFGIDIDYFFKVDFTSFKTAIDAIGGVELTVNDSNYYYFDLHNFSEIRGLSQAQACDGTHKIHLDGDGALRYARARHRSDGAENGDFTRTLHQRDLLMQFVNNCKDMSFDELDSLLDTVLPCVVTNMPADVMEDYFWNVLEYIRYDIGDARVPCAGSWEYYTTSKGASVLNINISANSKYVKAKIYG